MIRKIIFLLTGIICINMISPVLMGQENASFVKGEVIDTVTCLKNNTCSYSLYLPSGYAGNKEWPVIFLFDPAACGSLAAEICKPAAETYGYILAASNTSKNNIPWQQAFDAAVNMMEDVRARFSVDTQRIYVSGFSGGSRVAALIALNKNVAGVMGCGAGFPVLHKMPDSLPDFDYIGLVGLRDMNYQEMYILEKELSKKGISVRIYTWDFDHRWPADTMIRKAIQWIELRAMHRGLKKKEIHFIDTLYTQHIVRAKKHLEKGSLMKAVRLYRWLITDFGEYYDISKWERTIDSCTATRTYTSQVTEWEKIKLREMEAVEEINIAFSQLVYTGELADSTKNWWFSRVKKYRKMELSKNREKALMASRILNNVVMGCYIYAENLSTSQRTDKLIFLNRLWTVAEPENRYAFYYLARAYALNKDIRNSLKALERSAQLGFNRCDLMENDDAFLKVREEEEYRELWNKKY